MIFKTGDTIPAALKDHFFKGVSQPNLTEEYDVIGFGADTCLIKYNMPNLTRLITESYLAELHESFSYPKSILDFNYDS